MKATDLMIGDWVLMDMNFSEENPIYTQPDYRYYQIKNGEDINLACETNCLGDADVYLPIPLTPKILEKNGFVKSVSSPGIHAKCYELDNKDDRYCLTIANYNKYKRLLLNVDSEDAECFNMKCDYVHQLQHALKECEIKKEIVL